MTEQAEVRRQYKTQFLDFLNPDGGHGPRMDAIRKMISDKARRVNVDLADLRDYDATHEGMVQSWADRFPADEFAQIDAHLKEIADKDRPFFTSTA